MKLISREDAKALGRTRYFTGKPCKHGHVDERYVSTMGCVQCNRERVARSQAVKAQPVPTLISREDAQRQGCRWFYTGEPCSHGHVAQRSAATGHCRACDQAARTGLVDTVITVPQRDLALIKQIAADLCANR